MQFITVMIPLRFQLDALMNDLVWVIKREQRRRIKKTGHLCFFSPGVVAGHKNQPVVFVVCCFRLRTCGNESSGVLNAFGQRIVFNAALVWYFSVFLLYGPHLAANTLAAQPAPGDVLNSRTERFSGGEPLVEK